MPKSKASKKRDYNVNPGAVARAKPKAAPSSPWYVGVMLGLIVLGLLWLIVFYLASAYIPFMAALQSWNYLIAFGLIVVGLFMTMGWR
jgi:hypothetical protein